MAFGREYEVDGYENLFVTVLVKCNTCGNHGELVDGGGIEPIDGFVDSLDEHTECDVCGDCDWSEYAEHISIGVPSIGREYSPSHRVMTLDEHVGDLSKFTAKMEVAEENGFYLQDEIVDEGTVILWNELQ